MKKLLFILTLLSCLLQSQATTYYVSATGNDATGTGTISAPWASLHKACASVTASGDIIHVNAGHYADNTQCTLSVGVSIEGADSSQTFITTSFVGGAYYSAFIMVQSGTENTNGNQHITGITFDGNNLTGDRCIYIHERGNVEISYCAFKHFSAYAIYWRGTGGGYSSEPTTKAYNNRFNHSTMYDCAGNHNSSGGALQISGQDSLVMEYNMLVDTSRSAGNNGNIIGAVEGWNQGFKYLHNISWKPVTDIGNQYNCHLEFWNTRGGMEIAYNEFWGGGYMIDMAGSLAQSGKYSYSYKVHNNKFLYKNQSSSSTGYNGIAMQNESTVSDNMIIDSNYIEKAPVGVAIIIGYGSHEKTRNTYITHNVFKNIGWSDNGNNNVINISCYQNSTHAVYDTIINTYIYNNTIYNDGSLGQSRAGIELRNDTSLTVVKNTFIRNNIFYRAAGTSYGYLTFWEGSSSSIGLIDSVFSDHNIIYQNNNANNPYYRTGRTTSNCILVASSNINADPLINNDFTLQSGSPAINAGIDVGYGTDIGAYELPKDTEQTHAFFRRFLIVPFDITIPEEEQDSELPQRIIKTELSGVFNWVMEGLERLLQQKAFTNSEAVRVQLETYKKQSDSMQMFIEDERFKKSTDFMPLKEFYENYRDYCRDSGYHPISKKTLSDRLKNKGYAAERRSAGIAVFIKKEQVQLPAAGVDELFSV